MRPHRRHSANVVPAFGSTSEAIIAYCYVVERHFQVQSSKINALKWEKRKRTESRQNENHFCMTEHLPLVLTGYVKVRARTQGLS